MIEGLGQKAQHAGLEGDSTAGEESGGQVQVSLCPSGFSVLCLPAADEADGIGARLFIELLKPTGIHAECASVETLVVEMMDLVERHKPDVVCISALPPAAVRQACYLCKRIRTRFPELQIMVGLWDAQGERQKAIERIESAGANHTVTTFAQGLEHLGQLEKAFCSVTATAGGPIAVAL